jgi:hypothetical protein
MGEVVKAIRPAQSVLFLGDFIDAVDKMVPAMPFSDSVGEVGNLQTVSAKFTAANRQTPSGRFAFPIGSTVSRQFTQPPRLRQSPNCRIDTSSSQPPCLRCRANDSLRHSQISIPMTETIQQIREAWKEASQQIHDAPDQFKAHYPNLSPSQLDESIETFCKWAEKGNAPHGFKPVSSLARTMLAVEAGKLLNAIKQFNDSQDWVFPFLEPLGRALSFVSLAAVFSDKDDARQLVAEHGGKLAESLTLMDTAQAELGRKMESLKEADAAIERIKDHEITIAAKAKASEQSEQTIAESKEATSQHLEEIEATKDEIEELKTQVQTALQEAETLRKSNDSFQAKLKEQSDQLEALKAKAEIQAKTVAELLPNATSAGLASSYGDRARSFLPAMKLWRTLFMAAIAMLIVASWILVGYTIKQDTDTWHYLLLRLPVALLLFGSHGSAPSSMGMPCVSRSTTRSRRQQARHLQVIASIFSNLAE